MKYTVPHDRDQYSNLHQDNSNVTVPFHPYHMLLKVTDHIIFNILANFPLEKNVENDFADTIDLFLCHLTYWKRIYHYKYSMKSNQPSLLRRGQLDDMCAIQHFHLHIVLYYKYDTAVPYQFHMLQNKTTILTSLTIL